MIPLEDVDLQRFLTDCARSDLEKRSARIGQPGEVIEVVVSTHSASRENVQYAQRHGIDLIVVGSYGKHGIKGMSGSAANNVMHAAIVDVLIVHSAE